MGIGTDQNEELITHPLLGKVALVNEGEPLLHKMLPEYSEAVFLDWQMSLEVLRRKCPDTQSLYLPRVIKAEKGCGAGRTPSALFEHCPYTLADEISNRQSKEQHFSEEELWFIIFVLTECLSQFQTFNEKVAYMHPGNLLINRHGLIRIFNRYSLPAETAFSVRRYYPPEELQKERLANCFSDTYCLGLLILECSILEPCDRLFNPVTQEFDSELKKKYIEKLQSRKLSPFLKYTIRRMAKQKNRPSVGEVHAILTPYTASILDFAGFKFDQELSNRSLGSYFEQLSGFPHILTEYERHDVDISTDQDEPAPAYSYGHLPDPRDLSSDFSQSRRSSLPSNSQRDPPPSQRAPPPSSQRAPPPSSSQIAPPPPSSSQRAPPPSSSQLAPPPAPPEKELFRPQMISSTPLVPKQTKPVLTPINALMTSPQVPRLLNQVGRHSIRP